MKKIDWNSVIPYLYVSLISVIILVPFSVTFYRSLISPQGTLTLSNYLRMAGIFWPKVWLSAYLALITVVLDLILAIPAAYAIVRYNFKGKKLILTLLTAVWYVPGISYALALILSFYMLYKFCLSIWGFIFTYTTGFLPIMLLSCIVAFKQLETSYEEASLCLGANKLKTFIYVVLPLIGPGISSGILLAFVLSFNEFITAFLLAAPTGIETAPVKVFDDIAHAGMHSFVAAEASILQIISIVICFIYLKVIGSRYLRGTVLI